MYASIQSMDGTSMTNDFSLGAHAWLPSLPANLDQSSVLEIVSHSNLSPKVLTTPYAPTREETEAADWDICESHETVDTRNIVMLLCCEETVNKLGEKTMLQTPTVIFFH